MSNPGTVAEIQEKDTSVDDDIRAAFASLKEGAPADATAQPVAAAPIEGETAEQAAQRQRDEQGRFAKADSKAVSNKVTATGTPAAGALQAVVDPNAPPAAATVKPPEGWTAAEKAEFMKAPPAVQAAVTRREAEMHRKFTSQDEDRTFGKRVKETASPFMATILSEGGTVEQAFQQFLTTAQILRGNNPALKAQALRTIAQQFNVDLGIPLQQGANQQPQAYQAPNVEQLVQAGIEKYSQKLEESKLTGEIETFAADPANVHFEAVKPIMAALMQSGKADTLRDAYDQAIWADPSIRSTLTATQIAQTEEKRRTDALATADKARRASGSIAGGPGGAIPNGAVIERSLEDELRANFRAASGRV